MSLPEILEELKRLLPGDVPLVTAVPYGYRIAMHELKGYVGVGKMGYNGDVGTGEEDLWVVGGTYVFPTTEMGMEVVSSDNTQDKPAGTGVLSVHIDYLDGDYVEHSTSVTINGTTAVATDVTNIYRVQRFHVLSTGTGLKAVGNIDLRHLTDTPIYAWIGAGYTRSRTGVYTVPYRRNFFLASLVFSSGGTIKPTLFTFRSNWSEDEHKKLGFMLPLYEIQCTDSQFSIPIVVPDKFECGVDIIMSAKDGAASGLCSGVMRGWLESC